MTERPVPPLSPHQEVQLRELTDLALSFNRKINLYSKASADDFWSRHIEHSLVIASKKFPDGACVVDWGTGGGMPGLPLAILFPDTPFFLIDAVDKKIRAVRTIARRLDLSNVTAWHGRAERWDGTATHSVSRATAPLATLWTWHQRIAVKQDEDVVDAWPPGLICLKGGNLGAEIEELQTLDPETVVNVRPLPSVMEGRTSEKVIVTVMKNQNGY